MNPHLERFKHELFLAVWTRYRPLVALPCHMITQEAPFQSRSTFVLAPHHFERTVTLMILSTVSESEFILFYPSSGSINIIITLQLSKLNDNMKIYLKILYCTLIQGTTGERETPKSITNTLVSERPYAGFTLRHQI